ncbi:uncharacterized protein MONBRDRAFT_21920, partial [Monosiga brevicollis MX1]
MAATSAECVSLLVSMACAPAPPIHSFLANVPMRYSSARCDSAAALLQQIEAQGAKVRELKGANADKKEVEAAVQTLVGLKTAYKELTGEDLPGAKPSKGKKKGKADKKAEPKAAGAESKPSKSEKKAEAKPAKAAANKSKDESSGE